MARQSLSIDKFVTGVVSSPSLSDIPADAAQLSLDVDPFDELGKLKGRKDDSAKISSVNGSVFDLIDSPDNERDVIYYNPTTYHLRKITDFTGTPIEADIGAVATTDARVPMYKNNRELHVGLGMLSTNIPRWVGYIPHKQFGVESTTIVNEDARLLKPVTVSSMHKIVMDDTYIYGIEWGGKHIYKFDYVNGEYAGTSDIEFGSTRALALARDSGDAYTRYGDGDNSYLYVIDGDHESKNALLTVNRLDFEVIQTNIITTSLASNYEFSDMVETGDGGSNPYYLWLTLLYDTGVPQFDQATKIYNVAYTSNYDASGDIAITARDPYFGGTSAGVRGEWLKGVGPATIAEVCYALGKNPLYVANISAAYVGVIAFFANANTGTGEIDDSERAWLNTDGTGVGDTLDGLYNCVIRYNMTSNTLTSWNGSTGACFVRKLDGAILDVDYTSGSAVDLIDSVLELKSGSNYSLIFSYKATDEAVTGSNIYAFERLEAISTATWGNVSTARTNGDLALATVDSAIIASMDDSSPWDVYFMPSYGISRLATSARTYNTSWGTATAVISANVSILATGRGIGNLDGAEHWYGLSWLYDGYQESPLSREVIESDGNEYQDITINIYSAPRRATHINVYRGDNSTVSTIAPNSFYRLVKSIRLDSNFQEETESLWGDYNTNTIVDSDNRGATYDALVGISETLDNFTPHWALSTGMNGFQYIAKCYHPEIDDCALYMFKSMPGKPDQFNWINDYLILPELPTAIHAFNGRVYVWSSNHMYRINPEGMYIEDRYEGLGCVGQDAVCVTDFGMVFANTKNIFMHDGTSPQPIGDAIKSMQNSQAVGWNNMTLSSGVWIFFDSVNNAFIVFTQKAGQGYVFAYTLNMKRWDIWLTDDIRGGFVGDDGIVYFSDKTNLKSLATSSTRKQFLFTSRSDGLGKITSDKLFRRARIAYSGSALNTLNLKVNGSNATYSSNANLTVSGKLAVYDITANNEGQNFFWYITGHTDGTTEIDGLEVIASVRPPR
jgi:hypothetical protein